MDWNECYARHFERFLRMPSEVSTFTGFESARDIQIFSYDGVFDGYRAFATIGSTQFSQELNGIGEAYIVSRIGWNSIPYILANAIFYMAANSISLGWGVSIAGIESIDVKFSERFSKSSLYFTIPLGLPDDFDRLICSGQEGRVYMGTFLSAREHDFFVNHGSKALEDRFYDMSVDPFDPSRPSCL